MKRILLRFKNFMVAEITAVFICLIIGLALTGVLKMPKVSSVITSAAFIFLLYSAGWNEGRRDSRKVGESFPDFRGAVCSALLCGGVTLLLLLIRIMIYHINPTSWAPRGAGHEMIPVRSGALVAADVIYRLWNYHFIGFMASGSLSAYSLPILFPVIVYPISYKIGLTRFSFSEKVMPKILYKNKK